MTDDLDIFQFASLRDAPGLVHGLFGRAGGVSPAPWDSLNVGRDVGDAPAHIEANYRRLTDALGVRREDLVMVRQVHSARVRRVGAAERGQLVGEYDGLLTDEPEVPLILRFADCVPILVYDPVGPALGLAHAGWRGTLSGVAPALVQGMQEHFGSRSADLLAGIGPSIGPCCFEVGPEVAEAAQQALDGAGAALRAGQGDRSYLDLWEANRRLLERAGVAQIELAGICTCCQHERFFSHRGDAGHTGRFPMVAMLCARKRAQKRR